MLDDDDDLPDDDLEDEDDSVELSNDLKAAQEAEKPDSDDSGDESAESAAESGDSEVEKPAKRKMTADERFAELTRLRREAEKAAFEFEMKNIELEKRLAERDQGSSAAPKAPDPKDFAYGEVDPDYLTAVVDFKVASREQDIRTEAAKASEAAEVKKITEHYQKRYGEVLSSDKKRFADFEAVVDKTPFTAELARDILDSDSAVDIAYFLSNNVSELRTLVRATPAERARAIGRLEGRFSAASAVKKASKAPDPLGSRQSKAGSKSEPQYGPDNQDEFDKAFFAGR